MIALDELSRLGQSNRGNRFVVFDDELDRPSACAVPHLVQSQ